MTDEQIEKALERMATSRCSDVTNFDYADTLDYIKRLKDEIAGLTGAVEALKTDNANLTRTLEECNENLQENLEKAYEHNEDECKRCIQKVEAGQSLLLEETEKRVRQETAKAILKELKFLYAERQKEYTNWDGNKINAVTTEWLNADIEGIAEEYGVEVEE